MVMGGYRGFYKRHTTFAQASYTTIVVIVKSALQLRHENSCPLLHYNRNTMEWHVPYTMCIHSST